MTKIHYMLSAQPRYAEWGCLSVDSLLRRGGVPPASILVTVHKALVADPAVKLLADMGVSLRVLGNTFWSKVHLIDSVFREHPDTQQLVQIDSDCVLTEEVDLIDALSGVAPEAHVLAYPAHIPPAKVFSTRQKLFLPDFNPQGNEVQRRRLDSFLQAAFHISLSELELGLYQNPWVYGGVIVARRSVLESPAWKAAVAFSWICMCDETALMLALLHPQGVSFGEIPRQVLDHRVNPPVLDLNEGPGLVHFAGNWYRLENPHNKGILDRAYADLQKRWASEVA